MVTAQVRTLTSEGATPDATAQVFLKNQGWFMALQHVRSAIADIEHARTEQIELTISQVNGEEPEESVNARNQRRGTAESPAGED